MVQEAVAHRPEGPVILYSRELEPPEQRFVIAHAVGHLLYDGNAPGASVGFVGEPFREERADAFAAELLVPLDRLSLALDLDMSRSGDLFLDEIDTMASRFNVPRWLIRKRVQELPPFRY
jgi:Zn-dependent peptidase ImmA (M78 family)